MNTWKYKTLQIISIRLKYMISYKCVPTNDYRQIRNMLLKIMQWNFENNSACNQTFRDESIFSTKSPIRIWYAIKQIN